MKCGLGLLLCCAGLMQSPTARSSDNPIDLRVQQEHGEPLKPDGLYGVNIECPENAQPNTINLEKVREDSKSWVSTLLTKDRVLMHSIGISSRGEIGSETQNVGILYFHPLYLVSKTDINDSRAECKTTFLVVRPNGLFVRSTAGWAESNQLSPLVSQVGAALETAGPIIAFFLPGAGEAEAAVGIARGALLAGKVVKGAADVEKKAKGPIQSLLKLFDNEDSQKTSEVLKVGKTVVSTRYSLAEINIWPIISIVEDGTFVPALEALVDDNNDVKFDSANGDEIEIEKRFGRECNAVAQKLKDVGVTSKIDLAWALHHLATTSKTTTGDALDIREQQSCLGDYWELALTMFSELKKNPGAAQPLASELKPKMDIIINALGRYTQNGDQWTKDAAVKTLNANLGTKITIEDNTNELPPELGFWKGETEYDVRGLVGKLEEYGIKRFGCSNTTTSQSGEETGAQMVFLAFREELGVKDTCFNHAVAIYPLSSGPSDLKISKLSISNDVSWMKAALGGRGYCGASQSLRISESCSNEEKRR